MDGAIHFAASSRKAPRKTCRCSRETGSGTFSKMRFDCDNFEEYKLDDAAARLPDCEGVGQFSRRTPADECEEADLRASMKHVLNLLSPELREVLAAHIQEQREEARGETMLHVFAMFSRLLSYCVFPVCWTKIFGIVYAFDLPQHNEASMAEQARRLGCSRAALSFAAQDAARAFGVSPSRWLRGDSAVRSSGRARNLFVEQATP